MYKSFIILSVFFVLRCMAFYHPPTAVELESIGKQLKTAEDEYKARVTRWVEITNMPTATQNDIKAAVDAKEQAWIGYRAQWKAYKRYDMVAADKAARKAVRDARDKARAGTS